MRLGIPLALLVVLASVSADAASIQYDTYRTNRSFGTLTTFCDPSKIDCYAWDGYWGGGEPRVGAWSLSADGMTIVSDFAPDAITFHATASPSSPVPSGSKTVSNRGVAVFTVDELTAFTFAGSATGGAEAVLCVGGAVNDPFTRCVSGVAPLAECRRAGCPDAAGTLEPGVSYRFSYFAGATSADRSSASMVSGALRIAPIVPEPGPALLIGGGLALLGGRPRRR
ncbi:MAG: hypothetical protein DCC71_25325 [Proteobacteria bacterium]|nr:MAG: hypothetical protein DCC71_25325 [Pseudomonadota bacterium]